MTIANSVASKLFVGFVAIAMALSLVAPAQAATEAELQAQIDELMATINSLQSQAGQTTTGDSSSAVCPYAWTRSLSSGSTGADVMTLQKFLNSDTATQVSASGAGSAGMETSYYGPATAAAVSNFQVKYRDEILTPAGLVNPTGYFGPSSMAKANALCATASDDEGSDDEGSDDEETAELSGEGTLATFEIDEEETEVQEGDEDEVVMMLTMEAEDGDIRVDRLDFTITPDTGTANEENDAWDVFEEISLWVDGDKVAEFDASDEDAYLNEDLGEFRFSDIGLVLMEDEETEVSVAVTIASSVDGSDTANAADWNLEPVEVRYFDADDVASTEDSVDEMTTGADAGEQAHFDIEEEGTDDEATVESSSANPDAANLLVDEDTAESDEFVVHIFDIEVGNDSSDLEIGDAYVDVLVTNANPASAISGGQKDVIADIYMTIDGEKVTGEAVSGDSTSIALNGGTTSVQYLFEFDGDVVLEGDTDYEVEVSIVFEGQDGNYVNGVKVETSVDGSDWEVEGLANDDELTGTDSSEEHTLATVVPVISDNEFSVDRNEDGDAGTISYEFTIEADGEEDIDLDFTDVDDIDGSTDDIRFTLSGTDTTIAVASISKVGGDASLAGDTWTIADGDEATFVLDVTFTTASTTDNGTYRVTVDSIEGVEIDETSDGMSLTF